MDIIKFPRQARSAPAVPPAASEPRVQWLDDDLLEAIDQRARALANAHFRAYRKLLRKLVQWGGLDPRDVINWQPGDN